MPRGNSIYLEISRHGDTPIAGRFISWKIQQKRWMRTGNLPWATPHDLGNLQILLNKHPHEVHEVIVSSSHCRNFRSVTGELQPSGTFWACWACHEPGTSQARGRRGGRLGHLPHHENLVKHDGIEWDLIAIEWDFQQWDVNDRNMLKNSG